MLAEGGGCTLNFTCYIVHMLGPSIYGLQKHISGSPQKILETLSCPPK